MTYFLSDPIPAAYPFLFSAAEPGGGGTSEVGCYRHATGRNGNVKHRRK